MHSSRPPNPRPRAECFKMETRARPLGAEIKRDQDHRPTLNDTLECEARPKPLLKLILKMDVNK